MLDCYPSCILQFPANVQLPVAQKKSNQKKRNDVKGIPSHAHQARACDSTSILKYLYQINTYLTAKIRLHKRSDKLIPPFLNEHYSKKGKSIHVALTSDCRQTRFPRTVTEASSAPLRLWGLPLTRFSRRSLAPSAPTFR